MSWTRLRFLALLLWLCSFVAACGESGAEAPPAGPAAGTAAWQQLAETFGNCDLKPGEHMDGPSITDVLSEVTSWNVYEGQELQAAAGSEERDGDWRLIPVASASDGAETGAGQVKLSGTMFPGLQWAAENGAEVAVASLRQDSPVLASMMMVIPRDMDPFFAGNCAYESITLTLKEAYGATYGTDVAALAGLTGKELQAALPSATPVVPIDPGPPQLSDLTPKQKIGLTPISLAFQWPDSWNAENRTLGTRIDRGHGDRAMVTPEQNRQEIVAYLDEDSQLEVTAGDAGNKQVVIGTVRLTRDQLADPDRVVLVILQGAWPGDSTKPTDSIAEVRLVARTELTGPPNSSG